MTVTLVRVPLTLAAALAFHVAMSPPSTSHSDTPGDRRAVCANARFITTMLTKVRPSVRTRTPILTLSTESLGPILGLDNHRHPHLTRAARPHLAPHSSPHLYSACGDDPLLGQTSDAMGAGAGPTLIPPPPPPLPLLAARGHRRNDARPRRRISTIRRLQRPRPILRLPQSRPRPVHTPTARRTKPRTRTRTRTRACPRTHHDRTVRVRPASGVRRTRAVLHGSRRAPGRVLGCK